MYLSIFLTLYENNLQPDVVAPGYGIVAHMPIDIDTTTSDVPIPAKDIFEDKFKRQMILSGTSIASSFVAGAIAILKKYRSWSIFAIKSALVTTGNSLNFIVYMFFLFFFGKEFLHFF